MEDWLEDLIEESPQINYHYLTNVIHDEEIKKYFKT